MSPCAARHCIVTCCWWCAGGLQVLWVEGARGGGGQPQPLAHALARALAVQRLRRGERGRGSALLLYLQDCEQACSTVQYACALGVQRLRRAERERGSAPLLYLQDCRQASSRVQYALVCSMLCLYVKWCADCRKLLGAAAILLAEALTCLAMQAVSRQLVNHVEQRFG